MKLAASSLPMRAMRSSCAPGCSLRQATPSASTSASVRSKPSAAAPRARITPWSCGSSARTSRIFITWASVSQKMSFAPEFFRM